MSRMIPAATVAVVLFGVAAAPAAHATSDPSRTDTMSLYDTDVGKYRGNGAVVCHFYFEADNFAPGQTVSWWVDSSTGAQALSGQLTMDGTGSAVTGPISLPNDTYKLFSDQATGPKSFTVDCPEATQSLAAAPTDTRSQAPAPSEAALLPGFAPATVSPRASPDASSDASPSASVGASPSTTATPGVSPSATGTAVPGDLGAPLNSDAADGMSSAAGTDDRSSFMGNGVYIGGAVALALACLAASELLLRKTWHRQDGRRSTARDGRHGSGPDPDRRNRQR